MNDYMISQKFKRFQEVLLSDKAIHDLARVMRLPGFIHQKTKNGVTTDAFISRVVYVGKRYDKADLMTWLATMDTVVEQNTPLFRVSQKTGYTHTGSASDYVRQQANGRWQYVLARLGYDVGDGRHKPCPHCGGRDRFRFDNHNIQAGDGGWICSQGTGETAGVMVGAVWLGIIAKNSALVTSFVSLTGATLASTKASIANAFSVQGQITAYNAFSTRMMLLRLTKAHYIDLTKTAIAATAVYARSLVGLATSFDRTTLATKAATLTSIGWTKTKRGAIGVGILATRTITGLGGAFMALGRIITAHPIIAIGAVLASVVVSTHGVTGAINSLSDAFGVATLMAKDFITFIGNGFSVAWDAVSAFADNMLAKVGDTTKGSTGAFAGFFNTSHGGFVGMLQVAAKTFDLINAAAKAGAKNALHNFVQLGKTTKNIFIGIGNAFVSIIEMMINNAARKIDFLSTKANGMAKVLGIEASIPLIGTVSLGRLQYDNVDFGAVASIADNNTNSAYNYITQLADKATQATKANASLADSYNSVGSAATNAANATKNASDKTKKTADDITDAINELDALVAKLHHESHQLLNNSLSEMIFETDNKLGKFYGATEAQKQKLKDLAGQKDLYTATKKANDELKSLARTIKLVGKQTPFDELRNDLFDVRHEMSVLNGETKNNLLLWAANTENAKLAFELNQRSSQINTVILPIKDFLDEHKGVIPFLWTNPHGQTKKYVCENYEISQKKGNFWEIGLKFEQVF